MADFLSLYILINELIFEFSLENLNKHFHQKNRMIVNFFYSEVFQKDMGSDFIQKAGRIQNMSLKIRFFRKQETDNVDKSYKSKAM